MSAAKACQGDKSSDRRPTSRHIQPRGGRDRERRLMEACLHEVSVAAAACCDCDCRPSLQKNAGSLFDLISPLGFQLWWAGGEGLIQSLSIPLALSHFSFIYWEQKSSKKGVNHRPFEPLPHRTVGGRTLSREGCGVCQFYAGAYCSFSQIANICARIYFDILDHSCINFNFILADPYFIHFTDKYFFLIYFCFCCFVNAAFSLFLDMDRIWCSSLWYDTINLLSPWGNRSCTPAIHPTHLVARSIKINKWTETSR